jgi:hypothetical protein
MCVPHTRPTSSQLRCDVCAGQPAGPDTDIPSWGCGDRGQRTSKNHADLPRLVSNHLRYLLASFRKLGVVSTQPQRAVRARSPYEARPGRDAVVAASLADLRGLTAGTVELPLRLFWSSRDRSFDLGDPDMARCLYETVLREATGLDDLAAYLDGGMLVRIWPRLFLPKGVRRAWEERHPVLLAARVAAA